MNKEKERETTKLTKEKQKQKKRKRESMQKEIEEMLEANLKVRRKNAEENTGNRM